MPATSRRPARPRRLRMRIRRRLPGTILLCALVAAAAGVGLWLQIGERLAPDTVHPVSSAAADRVDIDAAIQRVDAAGRELTLRVLVMPASRSTPTMLRSAPTRTWCSWPRRAPQG